MLAYRLQNIDVKRKRESPVATAVLSEEWMKSYAELWNSSQTIRDGLKKLSMIIDYRLEEDTARVGQLEVVNGEVVRSGAPASGIKAEYVLTAKAEDWKRLGTGELPTAKAMVTRKVKFRGPMSVAMAHLPSLDAAMKLFGQVDETDWSA